MEILHQELKIEKSTINDKVIALAGNPNVGKSTVFNSLTGLNQHTGNWPGKTVTNAHGNYKHRNTNFIMVDLPGTYSLMSNSIEEEVARDFICFGNPDTTVLVVDGTCLERNLNLVLQTLEITSNVVVCVNLMDEAKKKGISIDLEKLSQLLGVPVVGTSAISGSGLKSLMNGVYDITFENISTNPIKITYDEIIEDSIKQVQSKLKATFDKKLNSRWLALKLIDGEHNLLDSINKYLNYNLANDNQLMEMVGNVQNDLEDRGINPQSLRDKIVSTLVKEAENISNKVVLIDNENYQSRDRKIDKYLTSKKFGIPLMILLLSLVFWITITGANVPSELLAKALFYIQDRLTDLFLWLYSFHYLLF